MSVRRNILPIMIAALFVAAQVALAGEFEKCLDVPATRTTLLVVVGAAGEETYGRVFEEEAALWSQTAAGGDVDWQLIGGPKSSAEAADSPAAVDKERLQMSIAAAASAPSQAPFWIVFIGHGTFDGRTAAFNLRGPDVTSAELSAWLKDCRRPVVVVNTTAASAPFLTTLSLPGRVVITATKSGQERNYACFGRYFAKRVSDPAADLDKDDQTSLFEAFLAAARDTAEFYRSEGRIATEHPLLDDNGDGRGVRADFFERDKLVKRPAGEQAVDGDVAKRFHLKPSAADRKLSPAQRAERDRLEAAVTALRKRKQELTEADYFAELERLLVALARLNQQPPESQRLPRQKTTLSPAAAK